MLFKLRTSAVRLNPHFDGTVGTFGTGKEFANTVDINKEI